MATPKRRSPSRYARGVLLRDALFELPSPETIRAYEEAENWEKARIEAEKRQQADRIRTILDERTQRLLAQDYAIDLEKLKSDLGYLRLRPEDVAVLEGPPNSPGAYLAEMQRQVLTLLRDEKYLCFGYSIPRRASDKPVPVPIDVLQSELSIDRRTSSLSGSGLEFHAVRLVPADQTDAGDTRGRRTRKDEIVAAYKKLRKAKKLVSKSPFKVVKEEIRGELISKPEDDWGLSLDPISRAVRKLHRPDVKASKSKKAKK